MDRAAIFGRHDHLMGVVSRPDYASPFDDVAVIMLTPGMLHNVGPFRMHVDLARWLSNQGIRSLRFDLSGIGESFGVGSTGRSIDRAATEAAAAMDWMAENEGCKNFILFGLCSGADDSLHTAQHDPRVGGFVVIDGCGFRTRRYYYHRIMSHYLPRILSPKKWMQIARRTFASSAAAPPTLQAGADVREFPERNEAARQLQTLADQGTQMHFVYTGGIAEYYNYENQFFDMLPDVRWRGTLSTKYFAHMDHVALLCEDREVLISHVGTKIVNFAESIADRLAHESRPAERTEVGFVTPDSLASPIPADANLSTEPTALAAGLASNVFPNQARG